MNVIARWGLVVVIVVGLGIDAYTHLDLADIYTGVKTSTVSEAAQLRLEGNAGLRAAVADRDPERTGIAELDAFKARIRQQFRHLVP